MSVTRRTQPRSVTPKSMPIPEIKADEDALKLLISKEETKETKLDKILDDYEKSLELSRNEHFRDHAARTLLALNCEKTCTFCLEEAEWGLLEGEDEDEGDEEDED